MRLLVVSDTRIQKLKGDYYAFNSVVNELNFIHKEFKFIRWMGYDFSGQALDGTLLKVDQHIVQKIILLPRSGGFRIIDKLKAILYSFFYILAIGKNVIFSDVIHVRGPSGPMWCTFIFSVIFRKKIWWFKYANDWSDTNASLSWKMQRRILQKLSWTKVTVNGSWSHEPSHIINFENPCFNESIVNRSNNTVEKSNFGKCKFLFVGRIEEKKGYQICLDALERVSEYYSNINLKIVGTGTDSHKLKRFLKRGDLNFYVDYLGNLSKNDVFELMKESDFLVLPSTASEGFPKVIAEAWINNCIPIVFSVSCVEQYVINRKNGLISDVRNTNGLIQLIKSALNLSTDDRMDLVNNGLISASKFTYERYLHRIRTEILK